MAVTKSGKFLVLLLIYFPTPILMSIHEICQCWVLTTEDDYFNTNRRDVLGKYWLVKDSNETAQQFYHRKQFKNEEGFTLWYDRTPQWAVYKNNFTEPPMIPGTDIVDQKDRVIQAGCKKEDLDECKAFNFTYHRSGGIDVEDSSMRLMCIDNYCVDTAGDHECKTFVDKSLCGAEYAKQHCRKSCEHCKDQDFGSGTQGGSSFLSISVGWTLIVIVISVLSIIVAVMLVIIVAVFFRKFFPKRSNRRNDYSNENKSYISLDMNETMTREDLQHHNCELEKKCLNLASQVRQISVAVEAIDVEVGLLQKTVHHVGNETQVFKAQPIKSREESIGDGINVKGTESISVCHPAHGLAMGGPQLAPQHQPHPTVLIQGQELLTLSMLAAAPPQEKKKMLGEVAPASRNDTGVENISSGLPIAPNMHNPSSGSLPSSQKVNGDTREPLSLLFVDLPTSGQSKISPASPKVSELKKTFE